jgi:phospholipid transport system substrate-binding protein
MTAQEKSLMESFRLALWGIICAGFLTLYTSAWASESPLERIRATTEQAIAILQDPSYQGQDHHQERIEKLKEVILSQFDSWEIAKRALGLHWRNRTEDEKKEFIRLVCALVEKSYGRLLDRYTSDVQFFFDQERIEDNFAEVETRVLTSFQDRPFSVNYRLRRVGERWLVYDLVIENVSMVRNYRSQFSRIINKSSYEGLVQAIERKLQELNASPSS